MAGVPQIFRSGVTDARRPFTDGLTEARDAGGVMFEDAALRPSLEGMQTTPVAVLVEKLGRLAADFGQDGIDDIAILGLRRGPI